MRNFLIRLIINAIALYLTASLLPGIQLGDDIGTVVIVALVFGIVNAIIKPILLLLTCPFVLLTLGLFILVVNALLLQLTGWLVGDRFTVDGFGTALLGGIVMGLIGLLVEALMGALGIREEEDDQG